jgi:hypothetical protein
MDGPGKSMSSFGRKIKQQYGVMQIRRHGFWFVDIPRTSSSSIKVELSKRYGVAYGKSNLIEKEHASLRIFDGHMPAKKIRRLVGEKTWERIFTFTFVRNPWDRMASLYHYRHKIGQISSDWSFREYILTLDKCSGVRGTIFQIPLFYRGSSDYILDDDGSILVDFIGRYETRDRDLKEIARKIGHESLGDAWIQRASPAGRHYSTYYDDETREIVRRRYQRDLDLFGYEFEEVPPDR